MLNFSQIGHRSYQGQVKGQNYIFNQSQFVKAEFTYKLCANRSGRFHIMFVYNGPPEIVYECQGPGQAKSIMVKIQQKM